MSILSVLVLMLNTSVYSEKRSLIYLHSIAALS
uniref:Uncharacterized protein n=1 Tax=Anguilla anguilla TaxID=7936 RepID=A0A0E9XC28_ANGAN